MRAPWEKGFWTRRPPKTLRRVFDPPVEADVEKELQFHLESLSRDLEKAGWSPQEARLEANRRFGDLAEISKSCRRHTEVHRRSRRRSEMFDELSQDLKFGARSLVRQPGFTVMALLTLALGIGATTALFSVIRGVLLSPLPFPEPAGLVAVWETREDGRSMGVSTPNFLDWQKESEGFEAIALLSRSSSSRTVLAAGEPMQAKVVQVSGPFFSLLGLQPALGRTFANEELRFGGPEAAVVSHGFWQRHLDGRNDLGSQPLSLGGKSYAVVGVMPAAFRFPEGTDLWIPLDPTADTTARTAHNWRVVARLRPGTPLTVARAEMTLLAADLKFRYGEENDAANVTLVPLRDDLVDDVKKPMWLLFGAAGLVLLIACTNLAGTLLARAMGRQREISIRAALGAGRSRMVRQLLTETLLLSLLGGGAGFLLARLLVAGLLALRPSGLVRAETIQLDAGMFVFSLALALVAGFLFGLIPALAATRGDVSNMLGEGTRGSSARGQTRFWNTLVATEVALALTLLVGAGLLIRSFEALRAVSPGFETADVLTAGISLGGVVRWPSGSDAEGIDQLKRQEAQLGQVLTELLEHMQAIPGVSQAGLINEIPLGGSDSNGAFCFPHESRRELGYASYRVVHGSYFEAMDIPLLEGRFFHSLDLPSSQPVVIVDASLADRYWPNESPLGKQICSFGMDLHGEEMMTVVGVVGSTIHRGLGEAPKPTYYVSARQRALRAENATLVFETPGSPQALAKPVRAAAREFAPLLPLEIETMTQKRARASDTERFHLLLLNLFAFLALVLAAVGIYGIVSFSVSRRTREIGIRVALGASPSRVVLLILRSTLAAVALGTVVGLLAAGQLSSLLASLLYGVGPLDGPTFLGATFLLGLIALSACWLPARRSTAIDPAEVMGTE